MQLKHMAPRLIDPAKGPEGGYSPNTIPKGRAVHLSNLALMLPRDMPLPEGAPIGKEELKKGCVSVPLSPRRDGEVAAR